jgi:prevent-host-death family protein
MQTIAISEFRAHMLDFLSKVESGETLVLTSRGKEIARVMPPKEAQKAARRELESIRKTARIGDVLSPVNVGNEWKA